jgi:hypothetical protein
VVYRKLLESSSRPLSSLINWRPTLEGNVEVLTETADYYRYFDATSHAEFLYGCVTKIVEKDLPNELKYLAAYDRFVNRIQTCFDMLNSRRDLLWVMALFAAERGKVIQARANERVLSVSQLTDEEVVEIEKSL